MTREEALEELDSLLIPRDGEQDKLADAFEMAIKALSQQTEYHGTEDMNGLYYCPICQQTTTVVKDGNKCPKCGSTMDELSTREQTEDAISRLAAVYIASGFCHPANVADELANLPSVTPKQRTGHWIKTISENGITSAARCSECGFEDNRYMLFGYCPSCGARMVEPQESEGAK